MQHVARIRSADGQLTSHAPVCRSSSVPFRCAVLRPRANHRRVKKPLPSRTPPPRDRATSSAAPAATLAWSLQRLLRARLERECWRVLAGRCATIPEPDTRTTRETGHDRTWSYAGRSRARTGARARNTADEKRTFSFSLFLPCSPSPPARPFFSETVNRAPRCTSPFEIERRPESRAESSESRRIRSCSFGTKRTSARFIPGEKEKRVAIESAIVMAELSFYRPRPRE